MILIIPVSYTHLILIGAVESVDISEEFAHEKLSPVLAMYKACLLYTSNGYPASICVSVNEEVVHGIPDRHRIIKEGDVISLDAGVIYRGYHSDAARTYILGEMCIRDRCKSELI